MAILSKVAYSAGWSCLEMALAVSVAGGCVLIFFNLKRLSTWTKNSIEQMKQVLGQRWDQVDFRHEKDHYSRLEDDQVDQGQMDQVSNTSSALWSSANDQQPFNSIGAGDDQRDQLSTAHSSQSPRTNIMKSETWRSSLVAEADGDSELQGTTSLVKNSMPLHKSSLNEPTITQEPINNAESRSDKGKHDMKKHYQVERDGEQKGLQLEEQGEGRSETSGLRFIDSWRLCRLEVADCCAVDDALCGIGSQHWLLTNGNTQTQEVSRELIELSHELSTSTGVPQVEHERLFMPETTDTASAVTLWRLTANRRTLTEEMILILKVAAHENN